MIAEAVVIGANKRVVHNGDLEVVVVDVAKLSEGTPEGDVVDHGVGVAIAIELHHRREADDSYLDLRPHPDKRLVPRPASRVPRVERVRATESALKEACEGLETSVERVLIDDLEVSIADLEVVGSSVLARLLLEVGSRGLAVLFGVHARANNVLSRIFWRA